MALRHIIDSESMFKIPLEKELNEASSRKSQQSRLKSSTFGRMKASVSKEAHEMLRHISLSLVVLRSGHKHSNFPCLCCSSS